MNRKQGTYIAACSHCKGIMAETAELDNSCSGLVGSNTGCGYTVDDAKGSDFEIIKVGHPAGTPIVHNDLIVLKSKPNAAADASFFAYLGTCGMASNSSCHNSGSVVRFFAGAAEDKELMPEALHFTISKAEDDAEGPILLGEFVHFAKAGTVEEGRGSLLTSCNRTGADVTVGDTCGAKSNLYTSFITGHSTEEDKWNAMWRVGVDVNGESGVTVNDNVAADQGGQADNTGTASNTAANTDNTGTADNTATNTDNTGTADDTADNTDNTGTANNTAASNQDNQDTGNQDSQASATGNATGNQSTNDTISKIETAIGGNEQAEQQAENSVLKGN